MASCYALRANKSLGVTNGGSSGIEEHSVRQSSGRERLLPICCFAFLVFGGDTWVWVRFLCGSGLSLGPLFISRV